MERPVYNIRGHHFLELAHFLYDDELSRELNESSISSKNGKEFVELQSRIWTEFIEGKCMIKLIDTYDKLCLETGCHKKPKKFCVGDDGKEDREFIEIAGLEAGKPCAYEEIKGNLHKPQWYDVQFYMRHPMCFWKEEHIQKLYKMKAEIERSEKSNPKLSPPYYWV